MGPWVWFFGRIQQDEKDLPRIIIERWKAETFHFHLDKSYIKDRCEIHRGHGAELFLEAEVGRKSYRSCEGSIHRGEREKYP
jgi:hypothetical protein